MAQVYDSNLSSHCLWRHRPPPPLLYEVEEIDDAITHAADTYRHDLTNYLAFAEWRTTRSQHPTMHPSHPLDAPPSEWNIYSPEQSHHSTQGRNINAFREAIRLNHTSHHTTHPLTTGSLTITDSELMDILDEYQSPLVLTIDGSFKPSPTLHVYPPRQPHPPTMAHAAASVTITALNNSHPTRPWVDLPTIPLLSRVQPLPAAYDTNNVTNNTAELLARIMACELLPADTPAIIIYDSTVVHSQHIALLGHSYTNRQCTRYVFPVISRMLAQRLEATSPRLPVEADPSLTYSTDDTPTLMDSILTHIRAMPPCGKTWLPHKHLTVVQQTTFIKIKSHQLKSNGHPKYRQDPQPCLALVHSNHWADKTCEIQLLNTSRNTFPLRCTTTRILSPLYFHPMNMYYGLYPVDTDVSDFTADAYQVEIILRLATKPEMGWYARNMVELQKPNRTIGYMGPTRRLITHQATSWTQQLYKDTDTRRDAQRLHHPHPTTPMKATAVTDAMKICPFCETSDTSVDNTI